MALYPANSTIKYSESSITEVTKTLSSTFDDVAEEQRKCKQLYPKRRITLGYEFLTKAEARTIWAFYRARKGAFGAFTWIDYKADTYVDEYIGIGTGSQSTWNLPGKSIQSYTVYLDDVEQTETTHYSISEGTGADGEDEITMVSTPAAGEVLTIDFTGYLKVRCTFEEDNLKRDLFPKDELVKSININLKGVLNA